MLAKYEAKDKYTCNATQSLTSAGFVQIKTLICLFYNILGLL